MPMTGAQIVDFLDTLKKIEGHLAAIAKNTKEAVVLQGVQGNRAPAR